MPDTAALVLGPAVLDRYPATGEVVPGGPALNVAWHWTRLGRDLTLVTRIGDDGAPVAEWLERHGIATTGSLRASGPTSSIDVEFTDDRQPVMSGFDPGVWERFALSADEVAAMRAAPCTHVVLTDAVIDAVLALDDPSPPSSGDFLTSAHVDEDRFARLLGRLDIGFVGWPGSPDDRAVAAMGATARAAGVVLVVTFGAHGIRVIDGRGRAAGDDDRWFDVDAVPVEGTTVGCGDAFIAGFLHRWLDDRTDLDAAVAAGAVRGAAATAWHRALPPTAYVPSAASTR